jgi:tight adherence protein C
VELAAGLFAALAVFVAVLTLTRPRAQDRAVSARLGNIERAMLEREALLALPLSQRVGGPIFEKARKMIVATFPSSMVHAIERQLESAGRPTTLNRFLVFEFVTAASAVVLIVITLASGTAGLQLLSLAMVCVILAVAPIYWLRIKGASRRKAILRALPDAVDLLVTSVEAGLAIDAAIAEVGRTTRGPLGEELRLTVRETTLGRGRREALQHLAERAQVPELKALVQTLIQAEQTGIPIGQVLRVQADQVRLRRRERAEAAAQRAPVKMIIVLVTLVLPAMLLFIVGPAVMRIQDSL